MPPSARRSCLARRFSNQPKSPNHALQRRLELGGWLGVSRPSFNSRLRYTCADGTLVLVFQRREAEETVDHPRRTCKIVGTLAVSKKCGASLVLVAQHAALGEDECARWEARERRGTRGCASRSQCHIRDGARARCGAGHSIRFAIACAWRQSSAARKTCSCVMAFSVRARQSRMSWPKKG